MALALLLGTQGSLKVHHYLGRLRGGPRLPQKGPPFRGSVAPPPPSAERDVQNSCPKSTSHSRRIHKVLRLSSPWNICSVTLASADQFRHAN
jgi:hypothetical protein